MLYANALGKVIDAAKPAIMCSREELKEGIAKISKKLKAPLGDAERILLCGERASLRKALQSQPA